LSIRSLSVIGSEDPGLHQLTHLGAQP
jgi:hypothetical protein